MKVVAATPMRTVARTLLADRTYDIEFHGYLSNHAKHAIIALERLQAPEERVQEYWDDYTRITPYNLSLHNVQQDWDTVKPATKAKYDAWKGKKTHWQEQVVFMNQELDARNGNTESLVADFAPHILDGMAGALTHGIIHLGWAIDAQSPWMITEGLAYLNFAHVGLDETKLQRNKHADVSPIDSLMRVAQTWKNENLKSEWVEKTKAKYDETFHPELVQAGFQWELSKVLYEPHAVALELPTWISDKKMDDLWESFYRTTVYLYLATRDDQGHGNFLVLHLITSLWGLEKTLEVIGDESISRKALGLYCATLVCLLATSSGGFPSATSLQAIQQSFAADKVDETTFDWGPIKKKGIAETEEHNIKLVYVMKELWKRYGRWSGFSEGAQSFTLTPNIGPNQATFTQ